MARSVLGIRSAQQSVQRIGVESARSVLDLCKFLDFVGCGILTPTANAGRWAACKIVDGGLS